MSNKWVASRNHQLCSVRFGSDSGLHESGRVDDPWRAGYKEKKQQEHGKIIRY